MATTFSAKQKPYSLSKARKILKQTYSLYKRKWRSLSKERLAEFEELLAQLDQEILGENRNEASALAQRLEVFTESYVRKTLFDHAKDLLVALFVALVVATIVRGMWFEPYEIPTGSMRPTLRELDRLVVSKTDFGLNIPLTTSHFYFDPSLVQRTGIFVFTVEDMDIADADTTYFYLFPGKKQFIKRCMGKPGDVLYFYGGKIYGIDKDGNDLPELRDAPWLEKIDHVPFITFEGKVSAAGPTAQGFYSPIFLHQMNKLIARLSILSDGSIRGEIFNQREWIPDRPESPEDSQIHAYNDFWGMKNFAMTRLLTREQVKEFTDFDLQKMEEGLLYLELFHNPSLTYPKPQLIRDEYGRIRPHLIPNTTIIPLQKHHLKTLMSQMYTSRFVVKEGRACPWLNSSAYEKSPFRPSFDGVPDGTYEFYYGKGYSVGWGGILHALPEDHPLYNLDPENIQKLFNLGIQMLTVFEPQGPYQYFQPSRYAYFREGDLYVMGAPLLHKEDPVLIAFNQREATHAAGSPVHRPYLPFKDNGPPMKDGKIDKEFLQTFGLRVPEKMYLALGDNYASSSDSRDFGFVPEANLRGGPSLIIWPPGSRWGLPAQGEYPLFTVPMIVIWSLLILLGTGYYICQHINHSRPIYKKLSEEKKDG